MIGEEEKGRRPRPCLGWRDGWRRWKVDKRSRVSSDSHFCPAPPSCPSRPCTATVRAPHQLFITSSPLLGLDVTQCCHLSVFPTLDPSHFIPHLLPPALSTFPPQPHSSESSPVGFMHHCLSFFCRFNSSWRKKQVEPL